MVPFAVKANTAVIMRRVPWAIAPRHRAGRSWSAAKSCAHPPAIGAPYGTRTRVCGHEAERVGGHAKDSHASARKQALHAPDPVRFLRKFGRLA